MNSNHVPMLSVPNSDDNIAVVGTVICLVAISESQDLQQPISNIEEEDKLLVGLEGENSATFDFEAILGLVCCDSPVFSFQ